MYTSIPQIRSLIAKTLHRCMWQLHWTVEKSKKFLFKKRIFSILNMIFNYVTGMGPWLRFLVWVVIRLKTLTRIWRRLELDPHCAWVNGFENNNICSMEDWTISYLLFNKYIKILHGKKIVRFSCCEIYLNDDTTEPRKLSDERLEIFYTNIYHHGIWSSGVTLNLD